MSCFSFDRYSFHLAAILFLGSTCLHNTAFSDSHVKEAWKPSRELRCRMVEEEPTEKEELKKEKMKTEGVGKAGANFAAYYAGLKFLHASNTLKDYVDSPLVGMSLGTNRYLMNLKKIELYLGGEFLYANSDRKLANQAAAGTSTNNEASFEMIELMILAGANWISFPFPERDVSLSLFTELGLGFSHRALTVRSVTTQETDYSAANGIGLRGQFGGKGSSHLDSGEVFFRFGAMLSMAPQYESSPLYYTGRRGKIDMNEIVWGPLLDLGIEL